MSNSEGHSLPLMELSIKDIEQFPDSIFLVHLNEHTTFPYAMLVTARYCTNKRFLTLLGYLQR